MEDSIQKSANQLYKESGSSLSFAEWIQREKDKGEFILNKSVQDSLSQMKLNLGIGKEKDIEKTPNNVVGLSKSVLIFSLLLITGAIAYNIYQKRK